MSVKKPFLAVLAISFVASLASCSGVSSIATSISQSSSGSASTALPSSESTKPLVSGIVPDSFAIERIEASEDTFTITAKASPHEGVDHYEYQLTQGDQKVHSGTISASDDSIVLEIPSLSPDTQYSLSVYAVDIDGNKVILVDKRSIKTSQIVTPPEPAYEAAILSYETVSLEEGNVTLSFMADKATKISYVLYQEVERKEAVVHGEIEVTKGSNFLTFEPNSLHRGRFVFDYFDTKDEGKAHREIAFYEIDENDFALANEIKGDEDEDSVSVQFQVYNPFGNCHYELRDNEVTVANAYGSQGTSALNANSLAKGESHSIDLYVVKDNGEERALWHLDKTVPEEKLPEATIEVEDITSVSATIVIALEDPRDEFSLCVISADGYEVIVDHATIQGNLENRYEVVGLNRDTTYRYLLQRMNGEAYVDYLQGTFTTKPLGSATLEATPDHANHVYHLQLNDFECDDAYTEALIAMNGETIFQGALLDLRNGKPDGDPWLYRNTNEVTFSLAVRPLIKQGDSLVGEGEFAEISSVTIPSSDLGISVKLTQDCWGKLTYKIEKPDDFDLPLYLHFTYSNDLYKNGSYLVGDDGIVTPESGYYDSYRLTIGDNPSLDIVSEASVLGRQPRLPSVEGLTLEPDYVGGTLSGKMVDPDQYGGDYALTISFDGKEVLRLPFTLNEDGSFSLAVDSLLSNKQYHYEILGKGQFFEASDFSVTSGSWNTKDFLGDYDPSCVMEGLEIKPTSVSFALRSLTEAKVTFKAKLGEQEKLVEVEALGEAKVTFTGLNANATYPLSIALVYQQNEIGLYQNSITTPKFEVQAEIVSVTPSYTGLEIVAEIIDPSLTASVYLNPYDEKGNSPAWSGNYSCEVVEKIQSGDKTTYRWNMTGLRPGMTYKVYVQGSFVAYPEHNENHDSDNPFAVKDIRTKSYVEDVPVTISNFLIEPSYLSATASFDFATGQGWDEANPHLRILKNGQEVEFQSNVTESNGQKRYQITGLEENAQYTAQIVIKDYKGDANVRVLEEAALQTLPTYAAKAVRKESESDSIGYDRIAVTFDIDNPALLSDITYMVGQQEYHLGCVEGQKTLFTDGVLRGNTQYTLTVFATYKGEKKTIATYEFLTASVFDSKAWEQPSLPTVSPVNGKPETLSFQFYNLPPVYEGAAYKAKIYNGSTLIRDLGEIASDTLYEADGFTGNTVYDGLSVEYSIGGESKSFGLGSAKTSEYAIPVLGNLAFDVSDREHVYLDFGYEPEYNLTYKHSDILDIIKLEKSGAENAIYEFVPTVGQNHVLLPLELVEATYEVNLYRDGGKRGWNSLDLRYLDNQSDTSFTVSGTRNNLTNDSCSLAFEISYDGAYEELVSKGKIIVERQVGGEVVESQSFAISEFGKNKTIVYANLPYFEYSYFFMRVEIGYSSFVAYGYNEMPFESLPPTPPNITSLEQTLSEGTLVLTPSFASSVEGFVLHGTYRYALEGKGKGELIYENGVFRVAAALPGDVVYITIVGYPEGYPQRTQTIYDGTITIEDPSSQATLSISANHLQFDVEIDFALQGSYVTDYTLVVTNDSNHAELYRKDFAKEDIENGKYELHILGLDGHCQIGDATIPLRFNLIEHHRYLGQEITYQSIQTKQITAERYLNAGIFYHSAYLLKDENWQIVDLSGLTEDAIVRIYVNDSLLASGKASELSQVTDYGYQQETGYSAELAIKTPNAKVGDTLQYRIEVVTDYEIVSENLDREVTRVEPHLYDAYETLDIQGHLIGAYRMLDGDGLGIDALRVYVDGQLYPIIAAPVEGHGYWDDAPEECYYHFQIHSPLPKASHDIRIVYFDGESEILLREKTVSYSEDQLCIASLDASLLCLGREHPLLTMGALIGGVPSGGCVILHYRVGLEERALRLEAISSQQISVEFSDLTMDDIGREFEFYLEIRDDQGELLATSDISTIPVKNIYNNQLTVTDEVAEGKHYAVLTWNWDASDLVVNGIAVSAGSDPKENRTSVTNATLLNQTSGQAKIRYPVFSHSTYWEMTLYTEEGTYVCHGKIDGIEPTHTVRLVSQDECSMKVSFSGGADLDEEYNAHYSYRLYCDDTLVHDWVVPGASAEMTIKDYELDEHNNKIKIRDGLTHRFVIEIGYLNYGLRKFDAVKIKNPAYPVEIKPTNASATCDESGLTVEAHFALNDSTNYRLYLFEVVDGVPVDEQGTVLLDENAAQVGSDITFYYHDASFTKAPGHTYQVGFLAWSKQAAFLWEEENGHMRPSGNVQTCCYWEV